MNCQETKERFVDALYRELDETQRGEFERHLASCAACHAEFRSMQATLDVMSRREIPEPDAAMMDNYWDRLRERVDGIPERPPAREKIESFPSITIPRWAYGIAAILLIALGVYIGRIFPGKTPAQEPRQQEIVRNGMTADTARPALEQEVEKYLDRSRTLLLGVVNNEDSSPALVERQQVRSRELIEKAVYLKAALNEPGDESLRKLIGDLEVILLQLANYSNDTGIPIIELVKEGVDQKSILLKINIEQIRALGAGERSQARTAEQSRQPGT